MNPDTGEIYTDPEAVEAAFRRGERLFLLSDAQASIMKQAAQAANKAPERPAQMPVGNRRSRRAAQRVAKRQERRAARPTR